MKESLAGFGVVAFLTTMLIGFAGLINHLLICLTDEKYILLIAGILAPPVGAAHGIGAWFGLW